MKTNRGGDSAWSRAVPLFDASKEFRAAGDSQPNGPWSYGWERQLSGPFYAYRRSFLVRYWGLGVIGWSQNGEGPENGSQCCPFVAENVSGQDLREQVVEIPAGQLWFHPGPNGEFSVVRWKNQDAGRYTIEALAYISVDAHVVKNGVPLMDGSLDGRGRWHDVLIRALPCGPGDLIDFVAGFGPDPSYVSDITGLDARITPVRRIS